MNILPLQKKQKEEKGEEVKKMLRMLIPVTFTSIHDYVNSNIIYLNIIVIFINYFTDFFTTNIKDVLIPNIFCSFKQYLLVYYFILFHTAYL